MVKIDSKMTIQKLLEHHTRATAAFIKRRMLCVGCPAQAFHSLEDAARFHGCTIDELGDAILEAIKMEEKP
jgi:hybrid cluster-associated redox disulfide protein